MLGGQGLEPRRGAAAWVDTEVAGQCDPTCSVGGLFRGCPSTASRGEAGVGLVAGVLD